MENMKIPKPTIKLCRPGMKFRKNVLNEIRFDETHDFARIDLAAHTWDEIIECHKVIKSQGMFIEDRFGQLKENPALKTERDLKVVFCRILRELNLDIEPGKESRLPSLY